MNLSQTQKRAIRNFYDSTIAEGLIRRLSNPRMIESRVRHTVSEEVHLLLFGCDRETYTQRTKTYTFTDTPAVQHVDTSPTNNDIQIGVHTLRINPMFHSK